MQRRKVWGRLRDSGYVTVIVGGILTTAMWVANNAAPQGTLIYTLQLLGIVVLGVGVALAAIGAVASRRM